MEGGNGMLVKSEFPGETEIGQENENPNKSSVARNVSLYDPRPGGAHRIRKGGGVGVQEE